MPRGTRNKHQEKSEATRAKLIKAALRVFSRDGFEAARIEDIATEAGHTRGAFYAQFQSKEDLFFALLEDELRKHHEKARALLARCSSNQARMRVLREYYVARGADRNWTVLMLEFKLYALRHPRMRAQFARAYRSIREKVKWESLEGVWPEKPRSLQERHLQKLVLIAALSGLVLERAYDPSSISRPELSASLRYLFDLVMNDR